MCVSLKARKSYLLLQLSDTMSKERTMKSENMHGKEKSPSLLQPHRYNQPLQNPPLFQMSLNLQTIHIPEAVPSGGEVCPTKQLQVWDAALPEIYSWAFGRHCGYSVTSFPCIYI